MMRNNACAPSCTSLQPTTRTLSTTIPQTTLTTKLLTTPHHRSTPTSERLPFTIAYIGSLLLTLYASLVARSYLLVVFSTALQLGR